MAAQSSLYDLLGVAPQSRPSEIRAAYYAAIKMCHPDVDDSPDASESARKLIEAYRVLSDPEGRKLYNARLRLDASLFGEPVEPGERQTAAEPAVADRNEPSVADPAARAAVSRSELHATADPDLPASAAPADGSGMNARVEPARAEVAFESDAGQPPRAADRTAERGAERRVWMRVSAAGLTFAAGFVLLVFAVSNFRSFDGRGFAATAAPKAATVAVQSDAAPRSAASPCLDLFSGLKGEQLYRECVRTRVKLHLRMMRLTSGAELQRDELQDAMAEIRQAVGAAQVHMASTRGFIEESVATFADVKRTATDQQVRRIAENYYYYYDCQALKHCAQ